MLQPKGVAMPEILAEGQLATHMVENQPPGLFGGDLWESDLGLKEHFANYCSCILCLQ